MNLEKERWRLLDHHKHEGLLAARAYEIMTWQEPLGEGKLRSSGQFQSHIIKKSQEGLEEPGYLQSTFLHANSNFRPPGSFIYSFSQWIHFVSSESHHFPVHILEPSHQDPPPFRRTNDLLCLSRPTCPSCLPSHGQQFPHSNG